MNALRRWLLNELCKEVSLFSNYINFSFKNEWNIMVLLHNLKTNRWRDMWINFSITVHFNSILQVKYLYLIEPHPKVRVSLSLSKTLNGTNQVFTRFLDLGTSISIFWKKWFIKKLTILTFHLKASAPGDQGWC